MILPNDRTANFDDGSNPPHTPDLLDQYLDAPPSTYSLIDYDETVQDLLMIPDPDPQWFTDFILYDSDDSITMTDATSVSETSGSFLVDWIGDIATTACYDFSTIPVPELNDIGVGNATGISQYVSTQTGIVDEDLTTVPIPNPLHHLWETVESACEMPVGSCFEGWSEVKSIESSRSHSISSTEQNNCRNRISIPRTRHYECPTCQRSCLSEYRLR
jgi:hypothetical protein